MIAVRATDGWKAEVVVQSRETHEEELGEEYKIGRRVSSAVP